MVWHDPLSHLDWELKTTRNVNDEYPLKGAVHYTDELNRMCFGGFDDWRLPTLDEMCSLALLPLFHYEGDYRQWKAWYESHEAFQKEGYFIKEPLQTAIGQYGWYWTQTPRDTKEYYLVNFKEGNTNFHVPTQEFYVRCVRGGCQ